MASVDPNQASAVQGYYQKYLGRAANPDDPEKWLTGQYGYGTDLGSIENAIRNSDEARQYSSRSGAPSQPGAGGDLRSMVDQQLAYAKSTDDPNYWYQKIGADPNGTGSAWAYWQDRINRGNGAQLGLPLYNDSGGSAYNTNTFSDPATQSYEKLLNSLIGKLNTNYQPPDYQNTIDQMKKYLDQLNGPAYTPEQQGIMATQALDPLERARYGAEQNTRNRLLAQGVAPTSGVIEDAIRQVDNQFTGARANTQAQLATNQIGVSRQNQALAAQLAPQISGFEHGNYNYNLGNQMNAASLAGIIPQLAWSRLQGANSAIQPLAPSALFGLQNQYQQQGYGNAADYMSQLMQLISQLFGGH